jgi:hypothetical protein
MNGYAELGMGGLLVLLALREMFGFLKARESNRNGSGPSSTSCPLNATIELWELKLSRAVVSGLNEALTPVLSRQTELLGIVLQNEAKMLEMLIRRDEHHG